MMQPEILQQAQNLPEWLQAVIAVITVFKGPVAIKAGYNKVQEMRGKGNGNGSTQKAIENHVVPVLNKMVDGQQATNILLERLVAESKRVADIELSICRNMNEHSKVMTILCDRMKIDRPDVTKLPERYAE